MWYPVLDEERGMVMNKSQPDLVDVYKRQRVYSAPAVTDEVAKATHLVDDLFDYYVAHTGEVPQEYRAISEGDDLRAVTDFIAGMTDRYAKNLYQRLFIPNALHY